MCPVELGANDYICRTHYNLLSPPTLIVTLLPGWLAAIWTHSTQLISFFSILHHTPFRSGRCPGLSPFLLQKYPPCSPPMQIHSSRLCSRPFRLRRLPHAQPRGLLFKFPLHLYSQSYTLVSKCFRRCNAGPLRAGTHVFMCSLEIFKSTLPGEIQRNKSNGCFLSSRRRG